MKKSLIAALATVTALFVLAGAANAQVPGTLYMKDGGKAQGYIRYLASSKAFEVTTTKKSVTIRVLERNVARMNIIKPKEISQAASHMAKKQYGSAIPLLKKVQKDYKYLQWDAYAIRGLAECYFENNMEAEGIKMVKEALKSDGGETLSINVVQRYWDELIKQKKYKELEDSIEKIVQTGARGVAAAALVKRGDMLRKKGQMKEAVVDGYLRTVVFFTTQKEARQEAVYKAMKTFQDLGQQTYADRMRKILKAEYPTGKWTKKAQNGV